MCRGTSRLGTLAVLLKTILWGLGAVHQCKQSTKTGKTSCTHSSGAQRALQLSPRRTCRSSRNSADKDTLIPPRDAGGAKVPMESLVTSKNELLPETPTGHVPPVSHISGDRDFLCVWGPIKENTHIQKAPILSPNSPRENILRGSLEMLVPRNKNTH